LTNEDGAPRAEEAAPSTTEDLAREWLEADGLGGFASGTVPGVRMRRYHALLLTARRPPTDRFVLVNGFDAWVETSAGRFAISSQAYGPGVISPDGAGRLEAFSLEPWPTWTYELEDGTHLTQELFVPRGSSVAVLAWRAVRGAGGGGATLEVRPFLSGRDSHALHHENSAFRFEAETEPGGFVHFRPYAQVPAMTFRSNGVYTHAPDWYRNLLYAMEAARGLDSSEDLGSPGTFRFSLDEGDAVLLLAAEGHDGALAGDRAEDALATLRRAERRRRKGLGSRLERSADAYLVRRGAGRTIVAGYPWFTDWGRDTFIAMRGLCLATGRLAEAGQILVEWAGAVSEGMLPNFFPDSGALPEFNSVDASLWFCIVVHEYLVSCAAAGRAVPRGDRAKLQDAFGAILSGYARGTRYGIRADADGLLAAGTPGVQLTWMDAKVGDWVVTPRIGKPVEVQGLWINALRIAAGFTEEFSGYLRLATESFEDRFWNAEAGCLHDVVDVDHVAGTADATFRPNQIFAVGGLPFALLDVDGERARRIVDAVEARLLTPLGLRTLPCDDPHYRPRYAGGVLERDGAYHQGTVWPWLAGPFVDAWVRVRGGSNEARNDARARFLAPLIAHLDQAGLSHVSEVADGDPPHTPGGCPFQAWSVGETLRIDRVILAPATRDENPREHETSGGDRRTPGGNRRTPRGTPRP
jgi:predicted glycogen debranching enzyme